MTNTTELRKTVTDKMECLVGYIEFLLKTNPIAKNSEIPAVLKECKEWLDTGLQSEIEAAEKAKEEQFKEDYIEWVLSTKPYTGQTPFQKWKMQAEVRQMSDWK